ncbi:uncharacterized protein LOC113228070 [Hyposmocoma kahamanoa]|uniref:uncharacterized protein LOC113228070 n=1 Tax=Hyposmocoma kahamanoa TaxID=1477025 RepID=UPI000E6D690A|nr:uncharacterized protein LOC113228070 [Hyposmocoma kahamanoa]
MEDDSHEENPPPTSRFRSPAFNKKETCALLQLIEKYKVVILNKSVTSAVCQAKDAAWTKIAKEFNKMGFDNQRQSESLRTKWENMKRDARRLSKDVLDSKFGDCSVTARIVGLICEADNMGAVDGPLDLIDNEIECNDSESEEQKDTTNNFKNIFDDGAERMSEIESGDDDGARNKKRRSLNFSPQECRVLLQCVRKEKKFVFCKEATLKAKELKNSAWSRITNAYNKLSPQKRSTKTLRIKFDNMKTRAKRAGDEYFRGIKRKKHEKLVEDSFSKIKKEPVREYKVDSESENADMDETEFSNHDSPLETYGDFTADPLSSVLNGDSGIGSTNMGTVNNTENKEIIKLKTELLNYQLETAKLERRKIENAIQEETKNCQIRAIERALRLRTARLEAIAAEARLPRAHLALHFTPEEAHAQNYLAQYQHEIN